MFIRRRHRLITALVALSCLLFMQLTLAAYACPGDASRMGEMAEMTSADMPCAGDMASTMDEIQPGLCHAHCQSSTPLSLDSAHAQTPSLVDTVSIGFAYSYAIDSALVAGPESPAQAPMLLRSTAPPIAVRNCCFRI